MHARDVPSILLAISLVTCASSQKPFDQMTAEEHRVAAAREHQLADESFAAIRGENIEPPDTFPTGGLYDFAYVGGGLYDPEVSDIYEPEAYTAWPRVSDPSEAQENAASKHRENALRHERAAAALEGRPSPQPLPPPKPPLLSLQPDRG